nr:lysylphosphatidylglycerol synthase domain-containing protein [Kofleriaceae bacterium]
MTRRRVLDAVALVAGAIGLGFVVRELGWAGMIDAIATAGAWFAVIAVIDVGSLACDAFAIHAFLRGRAPVSYARVFAAEASGLAINRLTPGNTLGEPVKVAMLSHGIAVEHAISAIVMFNLTTMFVGIAVIVTGVPLTALLVGLPDKAAVAVWVATAALVAFSIAVVILVRRGALASVVDAAARVRVIGAARAARWRAAVAQVDDSVRQFGGLRRGLAGVAVSRALNMCGSVLVLRAVGVALTPSLVIAALSVGAMVTSVANVVPLGLGIADGANYVLYGLLGATEHVGLLVTTVTRVRTCVLAALGLVIYAIASAIGGKPRRA